MLIHYNFLLNKYIFFSYLLHLINYNTFLANFSPNNKILFTYYYIFIKIFILL